MNNKNEDFQSLWKNQNTKIGDVDMELVKKVALKFDRTISFRNLRESIAGVFVTIVFTKMGLEQESLFEALACYEIALAGIFVSVYMYYHSMKNTVKENATSSTDYIQNHKDALNRQIKLLGSARYWYVAPIALGLVALEGYGIYEALKLNESIISNLISLGVTFALGAFVIYLNEVTGVKALKKELNALN